MLNNFICCEDITNKEVENDEFYVGVQSVAFKLLKVIQSPDEDVVPKGSEIMVHNSRGFEITVDEKPYTVVNLTEVILVK